MAPRVPDQRDELLELLERRLDRQDPPREHDGHVSGVLLPVRTGAQGPELVFTRRTDHLSSHPGEVSFPGGRIEPGDAGPMAAALRETEEEVGVPPDAVDVAGHLTDYQPFRGPLVCAYVGVLRDQAPEPHRASPGEVAEVLTVPVSSLLTPGGGERAPGGPWPVRGYEARVWWDEDQGDRLIHYWHLGDDTTIWGITGELLARFLRRTWNWEPEAGPRRIEDPTGFWE